MKLFHIRFLSTLILILNRNLASATVRDVQTDLKFSLMYLTEPLINKESIGELELDGAAIEQVGPYLKENFDKVIDNPEFGGVDFRHLASFRTAFQAGLEISFRISNSQSRSIFDKATATEIQNDLIEKLDGNESWLYVPTSWKGSDPHAIVLGFRKNADGAFNLVVLNTGAGVGSHYCAPDPNGVYPLLAQVWIEFENIPQNVIFDEEAWFIRSWILLGVRGSAEDIGRTSTLPVYFYGTVLANLREYVRKDVPEDPNLMIVAQRSGTCTMSSMLAALLHHFRDRKKFFLYRLIIGIQLLKDFLEKRKAENYILLKPFINDGFESFGRKAFGSIASGLSNFMSQYLEEAYPDYFKNSVLLGSGKSKWLNAKRDEALNQLASDAVAVNLLKMSVELGIQIHQILKQVPVNPQSNLIQISDTDRDKLKPILGEYNSFEVKNFGELSVNLGDAYKYLSGPTTRIASPAIEDIGNFIDVLDKCQSNRSVIAFDCALDVFKRVGDNWWLLIDEIETEEQALNLLRIISTFTTKYLNFTRKMRSFDNLLMLACFQLATWKAAKVYDNFNGNILELETFSAPNVLQKVIFSAYSWTSSGNYYDPQIWSNFDAINLYLLRNVLSELGKEEGKPRFIGPHEFERDTETQFYFDEINFDSKNKRLHDKLMELDAVTEILNTKGNKVATKKHVGLAIVLTEHQELSNVIPHYHLLLNTMFKIIWSFSAGNRTSKDYFIKPTSYVGDIEECQLELTPFPNNSSRYSEFIQVEHRDSDPLPTTELFHYSFVTKDLSHLDKFMFYRRIEAFSNKSNADIINLETWLNYVKGALDSEIFSSSHFQFISDRLINTPNLKAEDANGNVLSVEVKDTYPEGFEKRHVFEIYDAFLKLIEKDLSVILKKPPHMTFKDCSKLITKSVNIGIILARFIERVERDQIVSGKSVATLLGKLYSIFAPFGMIKNDLIFESDVSFVNLVLAKICSFEIRNSREFFLNIELEIDNECISFRSSLARVHYFIHKMTYVYKYLQYQSIRRDLIEIGSPFVPVDSNEVEFSNKVLEFLFLKRYAPMTETWSEFKYANDGNLVEMISADGFKIAIQLSNGLLAVNDIPVANKSVIINDITFQEMFRDDNDKFEALNGEAFRMGSNTVYVISNFRKLGIDFFFVKSDDNQECVAYRQWNNTWYYRVPNDALIDGLHLPTYFFRNYQLYKKVTTEKVEECIDGEVYDGEILDHEQILLDYSNDPALFRSHYRYSIYEDSKPKIAVSIKDYGVTCNLMTPKIIGRAWPAFSKHLNEFKSKTFGMGGCRQSDGRMIFIFPDFRFKDCPESILMISERSATEPEGFDILNRPDFMVEADQTIDGKVGLKGTLRIKSKDEESFLMVPFVQRSVNIYNKPLKRKNYIHPKYDIITYLELIQFINGVISPQTRFHRLLIAYYATLAFEFNLARELLHPVTSMHHNEVFSADEIEIIEWFLHITNEIPEIYAMSVFAYVHLMINKTKFPLEYGENGSIYSVRLDNLLDNIDHVIGMTFGSYLLSVRDLPEKYHLPKVFHEVLDKEFFKSIYGEIWSFSYSPNISTKLEEITSIEECFYIYEYGNHPNSDLTAHLSARLSVGSEHLIRYLYDRFNTPDSLKKMEALSKILKKHRIDSITKEKISSTGSYEMMLHCLLKRPDIWREFNDLIVSDKRRYGKLGKDGNVHGRRIIFNQAMLRCQSELSKDFEFFSQSPTEINYDLDHIYNSLADKNDSSDDSEEFEPEKFSLLDEDDKSKFTSVLAALESFLKSSKSFDNPTIELFPNVEMSKVLKKLSQSIKDYLAENGEAKSNELDLKLVPELIPLLNNFVAYLGTKIQSIDEHKAQMESDLAPRIRFDVEETHKLKNALNYIIGLMHEKKQKSFNDLYGCYQSGNLDCFQKKFPQLELKDCETLRLQTAEYFSYSVLIDYLRFIQGKFNILLDPSKTFTTVEEIGSICDELSKAFDLNERLTDQTILNFEFRSKKYRLKPEQVKDVGLLTSKETPISNLFKSVVIQRMMAAGKTLVLGTISTIKKAAKGTTLSILVPPSSLYQSNTSAMQIRTYSYFKKKGITFNFPRFPIQSDSQVQISFMKNVIKWMENTMSERNYLILSPDSLHSFLNSYIEALDVATSSWSADDVTKLELFAKIHKIFKENGSIILDEIDMTMDPRKELNFPTIDREPYNMTAAILITDLIEFAVFDDGVLKAGLDIYGNNQAKMNPNQYKNVKTLLLDYIDNQLKDENSLWYTLILKPKQIEALTPIKLMEFLRSEDLTYEKEWIKSIHDDNNQNMVNALIIIKVELLNYLKDSFKSTANLNYGLPGDNRVGKFYAVPYVAANTPSPTSEFADRWETLNKTLLTFAATSCNKQVTASIINYISEYIAKETSPNVPPDATAMYKNAKALLPDVNPLSLNGLLDKDINIMYKALKLRSPAAVRILFSFCVDKVFSEMTFATEQITSNALNMTSIFGSVQGYSGTIDNVNILPQEVIVDANKDHLVNEKNNGGIALKLLKDSEGSVVPELKNSDFSPDPETFVRNILKPFEAEKDSISAIIDSGAFFKNFSNFKVAKAILSILDERIKAVLYYNEKSNQLEFLRSSGTSYVQGYLSNTDPDSISKTTQTQLNERFTFYDHRHITGSDILQPEKAHAILTVGTRILLRDILQGTLRMRQFMTTQKVHMITSTSAKEFYFNRTGGEFGDLKVSEMLELGSMNEDDKQEFENEKLAFVKINNEARKFVLDEITLLINSDNGGANSKDLITAWFNNNRHLFIRIIQENPLSWLKKHEPRDSKKVLSELIKSQLRTLKNVIDENIKNQSIEINGYTEKIDERFEILKDKFAVMVSDKENIDSLLHFLKPTMVKSTSESQGTEVEMQLDVTVLVDLNIDNLIDDSITQYENKQPIQFDINVLDESKNLELPSSDTAQKHFISLHSVLNDPEITEIYKSMANNALLTNGKQVGASIDLLEVIQVPESNRRPFKIFSKFTREASHLLVQVLPEKIGLRVVLLSSTAAKHVKKALDSDDIAGESIFWLFDLSGRISATNDSISKPGMNVLDFMPASRLLIFDALVFNGSLSQILSSPHLKSIYFNNWLIEDFGSERAKFILLRMKVLMDRIERTAEKSNLDVIALLNVARGNFSTLIEAESEEPEKKSYISSELQKEPITLEFETEICTLKEIEKRSQVREVEIEGERLDVTQIFETIVGKINQTSDKMIVQFELNPGTAVCDEDQDPERDSFETLDHLVEINCWNDVPCCEIVQNRTSKPKAKVQMTIDTYEISDSESESSDSDNETQLLPENTEQINNPENPGNAAPSLNYVRQTGQTQNLVENNKSEQTQNNVDTTDSEAVSIYWIFVIVVVVILIGVTLVIYFKREVNEDIDETE